MTERQIISWIFLAIALASQKAPVDLKGISMIADGINHAVPTQKEMNLSLAWLLKNKLIQQADSKYQLTKTGMIEYNFASLHNKTIMNIWKNIERQFQNRL